MNKTKKTPKHVIRICKVRSCHNIAISEDGLCRIHYMSKHWKETHKPAPKKRGRKPKPEPKQENGDQDLLEFFTGEGYDDEVQQLIEKLKIETDF